MRARAWCIPAVLAVATVAAADPKPKPVDVKAFRDQLIVLQDAQGGVYVVLPTDEPRAWFGVAAGKPLYEQVKTGRSADHSRGSWSIAFWAPRVPHVEPGSLGRKPDGSYVKHCGNDHVVELSLVTGDKAKAVLDKAKFLSSALIRVPHLLARDDNGVYYYVDRISERYGGQGYRVFVGRKGAMKEVPLKDVASDSGGEVFSTRTGNLRIVVENETPGVPSSALWVRGSKRTNLVVLDPELNSPVIFKDLGVYTFLGTICDDI